MIDHPSDLSDKEVAAEAGAMVRQHPPESEIERTRHQQPLPLTDEL